MQSSVETLTALTGEDGHICGLVVTALWSEEIISISLVTARNNTAYCQHVGLAMFVLRQGGIVVTPHNGLHSGGLTLDQESFQIINREMVLWSPGPVVIQRPAKLNIEL